MSTSPRESSVKNSCSSEDNKGDINLPSGRSTYILQHGTPPADIGELWRDFLRTADTPSAYVAPDYFDEPYWEGLQPFAVLAMHDGNVVGALTGIHKGKHVVCGLPSRPQICVDRNFTGKVVNCCLLEGLLRESENAGLIDVFTWEWCPLSEFEHHGFKVKRVEANVVLDLTKGADELFKDFDEARKRNIRAALRNGIEVFEAATDEDAEAYYGVFRSWRETSRKAIHVDTSFAAAKKIQELGSTHRRFLARYQKKIIAATTVRFYAGGLIEYSANCSLDDFLKLRPNDLLIWRTIEWACQQGFQKYSLGGSHSFLRKSGGRIVPIYRYRLDRTFLRRHNVKDKLTDSGRQLLRNLPTPIAGTIRRVMGRRGGVLRK